MTIGIKGHLADLLSGDGVRAQFLRYALAGVVITALQAAVYWVLAELAGIHPQLANVAGYLAAVVSGYFIHGRFSFAGEAQRSGRGGGQAARFVIVSLLSLGLNAVWVWLCVDWAALPLWTPIPPMAIVTPALVFLLNRHWVFR